METEPDFVVAPRHANSLEKLADANPDGCSDKVIAAALVMPEESVQLSYEEITKQLRSILRAI